MVKIDKLTYHACNTGYSDLSCSPFVLSDGVLVSPGLVSQCTVVCSSARIGEYIESSCRRRSGRGLYYKVRVPPSFCCMPALFIAVTGLVIGYHLRGVSERTWERRICCKTDPRR